MMSADGGEGVGIPVAIRTGRSPLALLLMVLQDRLEKRETILALPQGVIIRYQEVIL